ncbi:hypothetical protein ACINK0_15440 [Deinococcus sp. VB343]|uniref:hypothetical protein n=1 Tax=Deinococcus sp. VB343 TaxID=3385567 RepID=UPI0039C99DC5
MTDNGSNLYLTFEEVHGEQVEVHLALDALYNDLIKSSARSCTSRPKFNGLLALGV